MREIKLRAWDEEKKEMHRAFDLSQNPKYWWEGNKDYPLMQYTGLHDKNGKDLYEDDLITFQLYNEWSNTWDKRNERVIWSMDRWTTDQTNYDLSMPSQYFEVIGNIYETEDY